MILAIGPYFGDFSTEIFEFRPFARWISEITDYEEIYIASYRNRKFLYNWIKEDHFISMYDFLSRNEFLQKNFINLEISSDDFKLFTKIFKQNIDRKNIKICNLSYTKGRLKIPDANKYYTSIKINDFDIGDEFKNRIIYIPQKGMGEKLALEIYYYLVNNNYNPLLLGDMKSYLIDKNYALHRLDYFQNGYKFIIKCIEHAKYVITPVNCWSLITNQLNKNLFSWGNNISQFKKDGQYFFNNYNSHIIYHDKGSKIENILNGIKYFVLGRTR